MSDEQCHHWRNTYGENIDFECPTYKILRRENEQLREDKAREHQQLLDALKKVVSNFITQDSYPEFNDAGDNARFIQLATIETNAREAIRAAMSARVESEKGNMPEPTTPQDKIQPIDPPKEEAPPQPCVWRAGCGDLSRCLATGACLMIMRS